MAESDDEGDGDVDVLDMEDFSNIGNGNFMCEPFFGAELLDFVNGIFLVDDSLYFCRECESDDEFDSDMNNCQCEEHVSGGFLPPD